MLEVYSDNAAVTAGGIMPLNNVKVCKGPVATLSGSTVCLNRRGVYRVTVDATATMTTAGIAGLQLTVGGVADPSAVTEASVAANGYAAMGFTAYIQVEDDTTPAPGSAPVRLQVLTTGADATEATWHVNVCAERICC